ncbi:glycosyltransferase [Marinobacterium rhizophilum]|uniref:glycosyltransferase n=1 Tax=Marinobacterium rhizophilum TaxID=420402 RepID=UPI000367F9CE|nr:glycosyltransferase [Marinobacterium rhizophilum]
MIFCTVGTQLPFDRLVEYLIEWQKAKQYKDIVFQVGSSNKFSPEDGYHKNISEPYFSGHFDQADIIVSHAGMGNIIRALDLNKAIIVVPRQSSLNEHINNHQMDTVDSLSGLPNLFCASNYAEFCDAMDQAEKYNPVDVSNNENLQGLIKAVADFVG